MIVLVFNELIFLQNQTQLLRTKTAAASTITQENGNIHIHKVATFKELHQIAAQSGVIRVGATNDPNRRANQYEREGYSGQMYYFKTENMRKAEDKLLEQAAGIHNVQQRSNAENKPGYVYAIKGRKYK